MNPTIFDHGVSTFCAFFEINLDLFAILSVTFIDSFYNSIFIPQGGSVYLNTDSLSNVSLPPKG